MGQHGTESYQESEKSSPETHYPGSKQMPDPSSFGYVEVVST
jgi:hypothetical protein